MQVLGGGFQITVPEQNPPRIAGPRRDEHTRAKRWMPST
jgi:hypothetical protein